MNTVTMILTGTAVVMMAAIVIGRHYHRDTAVGRIAGLKTQVADLKAQTADMASVVEQFEEFTAVVDEVITVLTGAEKASAMTCDDLLPAFTGINDVYTQRDNALRCTLPEGHAGLHEHDPVGDGIPIQRWYRLADGRVLT